MIDVEIEAEAWAEAAPDAEDLVRAAAQAALDHASRTGGVALLLTDDAVVRTLNAQFRSQDKATNVLSFPAPENPENYLGDVALAYGVCAAEAADQGKPLAAHLQHLTVHGVLHLLGYDHENDAEAETMEGLERVILAGLGVPNPYAAEQGDHG